MQMKTRISIAVLMGSAVLAASQVAKATTVGLPNVSGSTYAVWDTFSGFSFTDAVPGAANNTSASATLSSSMAWGMVLGNGGDRLYHGNDMGQTTAFNLTVNGLASGDIDTFYLWLKFTAPSTGGGRAGYFTATLDGDAGTGAQITPSVPGETAQGVVQYAWTGLDIDAGDSFTFSITSPASGHVSLDAIQLSTVPEPTAMAALGAGLVALMARRRPSTR